MSGPTPAVVQSSDRRRPPRRPPYTVAENRKKVGEEVNEVGGHFGVSGLGEPTLE
ncbi:hypothetical protein V6Z11_A05G432300 [Gossypium hirsutum]